MKLRIGPYAAGAWTITVWVILAFWLGSVLRIPSGWPWWLYIALNAIPMGFVDRRLQERVSRAWFHNGLPIRLKLTPGRLLVVAIIALLWCIEYTGIFLYAPHLIVGGPVLVVVSLFWILPLIVATILEISWLRQDVG
jgi:hypothetical protein